MAGEFDIPIVAISAVALLCFHHVFAFVYKLYNKVWSYASVGELLAIVQAVTLSIVCTGVVQFFLNGFSVYKRALIVTRLLHITFIAGSRFVWRVYRDRYLTGKKNKHRTLFVRAGSAGAIITIQLRHENISAKLYPVGFIDANPTQQKMQLYNTPVVGLVTDIPEIVLEYNINHIVIAIPSLTRAELNIIIEQ